MSPFRSGIKRHAPNPKKFTEPNVEDALDNLELDPDEEERARTEYEQDRAEWLLD